MKKRCLILGLALFAWPVFAAPLTIENGLLRVTYDDGPCTFSIVRIVDGKTIIANGKLAVSGAAVLTKEPPMDGSGPTQAISVVDAEGRVSDLIACANDPFIYVSEIIKNSGTQDEIINRNPVVTFDCDLDGPKDRLALRGTGGLHAAGEYAPRSHPWLGPIWDKITRHPYRQPGGSYEWLAIADVASRHGLVAGFVLQDQATGVLTPRFQGGKLSVEARSEFGLLRVKPDQPTQCGLLAIGYFDDVRFGLEKWADEIAKRNDIKLPPQPAGYCTWYAEQHGGSSDEKALAETVDFIHKNLEPFGMNFVQIDDGWQLGDSHGNGPNKNFTGFNPKGPYSSGMKATADEIKTNGLTPGLWFIPFGGTFDDPWFADKQDLFMKTKDGKPFDTQWGGTCLDMTNPKAQEYLKGIVNNVVHDWGYTYLKLDGFCTGLGAKQIYINSDYNDDHWGEAVPADPSKTYVETFRNGVKLIRDAAGPNVFLLGCNTAQNMRVYGGSFGYVDAMRIGPDNAGTWKDWSEASPLYGSRNYFLNGRVWYNDPDPCYVRTALTLDEARTSASWTAISGQLYTNSDWLPGLPPERLDIIKRTVAPHGKIARPVDFLENDPPRVWQVIEDNSSAQTDVVSSSLDTIDTVRRDVVALYNWSDKEAKFDVPLKSLNLVRYVCNEKGRPLKYWKDAHYAAFDFWANQFLPDIPVDGTISATLPPHACKIIALRPMVDHPVILSTSAHVTQGMTDILEEHWDPATRRLSGKSKVVAGDPYELRLATPDPNQHWKIFQAGLNDFHDPHGVTIIQGDKDHRAKFVANQDGVVSWLFVF